MRFFAALASTNAGINKKKQGEQIKFSPKFYQENLLFYNNGI